MSQPQTPDQKQFLITPYPFNSPVGAKLVKALDDELEAMYPDWKTLPHPGYMPEFRLVSDGYTIPKLEPNEDDHDNSHSQSATTPSPHPALDALDATANEATPKAVYFFVAFDVTDTDTNTDPLPTISSSSSTFGNKPNPIGCVALRPLPHFPSHRATVEIPSSTPPTIAEIKRMYVAPSHRGRQHAVFTTPYTTTTTTTTTTPTVAETLLSTAATLAKSKGFEKLVLEVGVRQIAALKTYERLGWRRREVFGDYVGASEGDGGISRCYELVL